MSASLLFRSFAVSIFFMVNTSAKKICLWEPYTVYKGSRYSDWLRGWTTDMLEFESWQDQEFSPLHDVHTDSGVQPASYSMGTRGSFPGVKWPGVKLTTHLLLVPREEKMWIYTSTPPYSFMTEHRDNIK
jgi:hypothetical protein